MFYKQIFGFWASLEGYFLWKLNIKSFNIKIIFLNSLLSTEEKVRGCLSWFDLSIIHSRKNVIHRSHLICTTALVLENNVGILFFGFVHRFNEVADCMTIAITFNKLCVLLVKTISGNQRTWSKSLIGYFRKLMKFWTIIWTIQIIWLTKRAEPPPCSLYVKVNTHWSQNLRTTNKL